MYTLALSPHEFCDARIHYWLTFAKHETVLFREATMDLVLPAVLSGAAASATAREGTANAYCSGWHYLSCSILHRLVSLTSTISTRSS